MKIEKSKYYRYVGGGPGDGEIHFVTSDGGQVTTWSNDKSRMSWLGTAEEFRKNFVELNDDL